MVEMTDLELLGALGVEVKEEQKKKRTPKEERIIAGFEEIQKFVEEKGRAPAHGENNDIFERLYATRLDQIRKQAECRDLVAEMDHQGLLEGAPEIADELPADIGDDELLAQLGVERKEDDVTVLKHVRTRAEVRAAEEIASREKCEDFEKFKPLFDVAQNDLDTGARETAKFRKDAGFLKTDIKQGQFIILGGQIAYIAEVGEYFRAPNGEDDARLRVIYSNGTESDILLRSLIRGMYKDETSRLISDPNAGPLFSGIVEDDDLPSGTIYVLRSMSDHSVVSENREVLHKIGVTGGDVEKRIANAKHEATYLLADVEIVATYKLANINRTKMEKLLHKFFDAARLEIEIKDRFGNPVTPREWFLVPLFIIDEVVDKIRDGSIKNYSYDVVRAKLILMEQKLRD
jgi:Meiotically up-regulated gene 113